MLKKQIKYTDYDGVVRNENFYFNLSKAELMDLELGTVGGLRQMMQNIIDKQDVPKIIDTFKMLIYKSYGEKSPDGRRFIKSKELSEAFMQTEAYSTLYMELISDGNAAAAFITGIVPADISGAINEQKTEESGNVSLLSDVTPKQ